MPKPHGQSVTELGFESSLSDFHAHTISTKTHSFILSTNIHSSNREPLILQVKNERDWKKKKRMKGTGIFKLKGIWGVVGTNVSV